MDNDLTLYLQKLKVANKSNTRARMILFKVLQKADHKPLSPSQLVESCIHQIDRSSVYRSIATLEKAGIIRRVTIGWKYKLELSDEFHGHHHHLTCIKCGTTIVPTDSLELEQIISQISSKSGFRPTDHQFEVRGYCENCQ